MGQPCQGQPIRLLVQNFASNRFSPQERWRGDLQQETSLTLPI